MYNISCHAKKTQYLPCRSFSQQGFTLLEVMIALAILAVASAGLLTASSGYVRQSSQLEQRVIANWVAQNKMNELRLAGTPPGIGESSSEAELAGRHFLVKAQVFSTESPFLVRVELEVYRHEDGDTASAKSFALARLTSFMRTEL